MSCSRQQTDKDVDFKRFEGKTVAELLEYLHTQYGCYTKYDIVPNVALGTLGWYSFLYYDSVEVREVTVIIKQPDKLRYVPTSVPIEQLIKRPLDHSFPLYLFKKEKIDKVTMRIHPLQEWLAQEISLDSLRYTSMERDIKKDLLLHRSERKPDTTSADREE